MNRRFRLRKRTDLERVRRDGKSYAHPLLVLVVLPNNLEISRFGVIAGRSVGGAVQRNRAKRRIRGVLTVLLPFISNGWDMIVITRKKIHGADFETLKAAVQGLFQRARLWKTE